jgi:tRNA threonylcarbamoyladenosine biosynthesis protein TsaB
LKILAVETATPACSAALLVDGEIFARFQMAPREHTKLILPMIEELLQQAGLSVNQLDALAFGRGPGSFTGVRIATGVAQGIAFGADLPVVPVSTLASMAQTVFNQGDYRQAFTALDARMGEIFWAVYQQDQQGLAETVGVETVTVAENIIFPESEGIGIGSGWGVYGEMLKNKLKEQLLAIETDIWPMAATIVQLAERDYQQGLAVAPELAMPVYLRDKVAKKESER